MDYESMTRIGWIVNKILAEERVGEDDQYREHRETLLKEFAQQLNLWFPTFEHNVIEFGGRPIMNTVVAKYDTLKGFNINY